MAQYALGNNRYGDTPEVETCYVSIDEVLQYLNITKLQYWLQSIKTAMAKSQRKREHTTKLEVARKKQGRARISLWAYKSEIGGLNTTLPTISQQKLSRVHYNIDITLSEGGTGEC